MTPNATNITPDQRERPVVRAGRWDAPALSSRRNSPKRLTAKPTPIKPRPVRIHARKVLSAAKYTLGSSSAGLSIQGLYLQQPGDAFTELGGVERCANLDVIVEIDIHIATLSFCRIALTCLSAVLDFLSAGPGDDPASPNIQGFRFVAAGVQLFTTMKTAVDERGSHIHQQWPLHRIRHHQPHSVTSQKPDEFFADKALVPNLERVTYGQIPLHLKPGAVIQTVIMIARKLGRLRLSRGQQR